MKKEITFEIVNNIQGSVESNFLELKTQLARELVKFERFVVSEEAIQDAKKVRANLNKISELIQTKRKEFKKEILKPYEKVESQAKELNEMIAKVNARIDNQIKEFEEKEREKKKDLIYELLSAHKKVLPFDIKIPFDEIWLNKTTTLKRVEEEIIEKINQIEKDLKEIKEVELPQLFKNFLITKYQSTLDMDVIKAEIKNYKISQQLKEKLEKEKEQTQKEEPVQKIEPVSASESVDDYEFEVEFTSLEPEPEPEPVIKKAKKYRLTFEVYATIEELTKLSEFLKANDYIYQRMN